MFGKKAEKKADKARAKKWRAEEAKRKRRGQPVELPTKAADATLDQISENVQQHAMRAIVNRLPESKRRSWPKGQADYTVEGLHAVFFIEIEHTSGKRIACKKRELIAELDSPSLQKAVGEYMAREIVAGVLEYYRYEGTDGEDRLPKSSAGTPIPPKIKRITHTLGDEYERMVEAEYEAKRKRVGKCGPICLLCGAEDRDAFPDWGTCPHGVEE